MQELDLEKIRQEIDKVDQQLADVLESRLHLVMQVAAYKNPKDCLLRTKTVKLRLSKRLQAFWRTRNIPWL